MKQVAIKELKGGDYFTLKDYGEYPDENKVYVRGEYIRGEKRYEVYKWADVNHFSLMKGTRMVYTDFTFQLSTYFEGGYYDN